MAYESLVAFVLALVVIVMLVQLVLSVLRTLAIIKIRNMIKEHLFPNPSKQKSNIGFKKVEEPEVIEQEVEPEPIESEQEPKPTIMQKVKLTKEQVLQRMGEGRRKAKAKRDAKKEAKKQSDESEREV